MTQSYNIQRHHKEDVQHLHDDVILEEPLEIKITHKGKSQNLAVTMRTPGQDFDLVLGFLYTEGIIHNYKDVAKIAYSAAHQSDTDQHQAVNVFLHDHVNFDISKIERHFYSTSSCGVCGKSSIEMTKQQGLFVLNHSKPIFTKDIIYDLANTLMNAQSIFNQTGGNHAVALVSDDGNLLEVMEDVGRHNAMDKIIGKSLKEQALPSTDLAVIVSGRARFELVQKAWMAGIPIMMSIGAPTSLAIELAREIGMTLIGFLSDSKFNVYAYPDRIR